jgi:hypothetical protein
MTREQAAALLGLGDVASRSDILHAFSRQARLTHPDLLPDPTPETVRAANDRFVLLTAARDLLLTAPDPARAATDGGQRASFRDPAGGDERGRGDSPAGADDGAEPPEEFPRVTYVYEGAGRRKRHGMGSSIATVLVLAVVLVSMVSWQDSWRMHLLGLDRDLTAVTEVTSVADPLGSSDDCLGTGACVLVNLTTPEDCAKASARFEVTPAGTGDPTTETRELSGLRAGTPVEVALPGRRAELLFLGCAGSG